MALKKGQSDLFAKMPEPDLLPVKTIRIAVSGDVFITETERKVIDTPAFQRLRRIKQLGTSYLIYPSAVHTRFEHSLGTLKIADLMAQKIRRSVEIQEKKGYLGLSNVNDFDRQIIRLAALLHDITQIPFGHTLEDELHVIEPNHESDTKRFEHFLGKDTDIGNILLSQIGEGGYDLLTKVLKAKKDDIEALGDKAYIYDIVKNTVCADLLDYLRRDAYYCNLKLEFGDRFLNFLFLAKITNSAGKDTTRLVIRIWKEKEKKHRRDIIDELINLLNCRFFLGSGVYFHHAKIITSAMISRAIKQALDSKILNRKKLWNMGDDEVLHLLANNKKDKLAKDLADFLLYRNFYKDFFEFSRLEAEFIEEVKLLDIIEVRFHKDTLNRTKEENRLSEVYPEAKEGDVLIYCPEKEMALKEAEMLILWKKKYIPLHKIEDKLANWKIENILDSHRKLWSFKVFISPSLKNKIENQAINEALLREWCGDLVKVGEERNKHFRCILDMTIFDVLQAKGIFSSEITEGVCNKVYSQIEEFSRGKSKEKIGRKNIENIIDDLLKQEIKSEKS